MSNTTANGGRSRRRAERQAGPPVEDAQLTKAESSSSTTAKPVASKAIEQAETTPVVAAESTVPEVVVTVDGGAAEQSAGAIDSDTAKVDAIDLSKAVDTADTVTVETAEAVSADPENSADADSEASDTKSRSRFRALGRVGMAAAVVAVISALVLAGSGGVFFYHQHQANALHERRAEYIQVAKQTVINLSTMKDGTADQDIDRILSVVSGDLKAEYSQNRDLYKQIFQQIKVQSNGTVLAAAIEDEGPDLAHVLVLGQQTVTNAASNQPQLKDYRFRVTVTKDGNGNVTASKLEFVA
ncbi:hypothetical protein OHB26_08545 [Nocardia sp. NBC_01503]|uniref:hypothetical protein n=1 Tax=Nocardia sp. NBC_01503 TaxID=2975997 RepID=UPI002E7C396C|nr:hypothetical protein [Nocardia sp. NBC_01503]WTL34236.1 hypothetical protein OHB26_08545 [Nocardia sp. NBC_01503]